MVATSLIDKLFNTSVSTLESLHDLNAFVLTFDESIYLLNSLNIPDLGSFILFSMAFRCLPLFSRKLFESTYLFNYPTINELLEFAQSRISILENVGDVWKSSGQPKSFMHIGKDKPGKSSPMAMVITKPTNNVEICPCYNGNYTLDICTSFQSLSVDDRNKWTRGHYRCFICLSEKRGSNKCRSKIRCNMCSRKHHNLLHGTTIVRNANSAKPFGDVVCTAASLPRLDNSASTLLEMALAYVRNRAGTWQTVHVLLSFASQITVVTVACSG